MIRRAGSSLATAALALAGIFACDGDGVTAIPNAEFANRSARSLRPSQLARSVVNVGLCVVSIVERDSAGRFLRWRSARPERVQVSSSPHDTTISRYGILKFADSGQETLEANCVLRNGSAASSFARGFLRDRSAALLVSGSGRAAGIGLGTICVFVDDDDHVMDCQGERCFEDVAAELRGFAKDVTSAGSTRGGPPMANIVMRVWECEGGGGISLGSNGIYTFHIPGTSTPPVGSEDAPPSGGGEGCPTAPADTTPPAPELRWGAICVETLPDGMTAAAWDLLTFGEKALVRSDPMKWVPRILGAMNGIKNNAYDESFRLSGVFAWVPDSEQNALQHAIWAAGMMRAYGYTDAKAWLDAHETIGRTLTADEIRSRNMDYYNNRIGFQAANDTGESGSASADVEQDRLFLCWLIGVGASSSCGP